jgi:glycosyltransferase involved in cell wall biosynthesis
MPSSKPLVSVLVPVLNAARFLPEALASVNAQTYAPLEIIVVDGPSTDDTARIAQSFPRVRYLRQTGVNMFNALNEGLEAARCEYIAMISGDDLWTPGKLQMQVEHLQRHPETDCVFGLTKHVFLDGEIPHGFRTEFLQGEHAAMYLEAMLVRKTVFEHVGKFDETLRQASDTDWFARFSHLNLRRDFIPRVVLSRRMHATNLSHTLGGNLYHELLVATRAQTVRHRAGKRK